MEETPDQIRNRVEIEMITVLTEAWEAGANVNRKRFVEVLFSQSTKGAQILLSMYTNNYIDMERSTVERLLSGVEQPVWARRNRIVKFAPRPPHFYRVITELIPLWNLIEKIGIVYL